MVGFEGFYEVSAQGPIRSVPRTTIRSNGSPLTVRGLVLASKPWGDDEYPHVTLHRPGKTTTVRVHVVVLEAFIGPRPLGHVGRHADDDPMNNAASNLSWGLPLDNSADMVANGGSTKGTRNPQAKLTEPQVVEIRRLYRAGGCSYAALAEEFGIGMVTVADIITRKSWSHLGEADAST